MNRGLSLIGHRVQVRGHNAHQVHFVVVGGFDGRLCATWVSYFFPQAYEWARITYDLGRHDRDGMRSAARDRIARWWSEEDSCLASIEEAGGGKRRKWSRRRAASLICCRCKTVVSSLSLHPVSLWDE